MTRRRTVRVQLADAGYIVHAGSGLLADASLLPSDLQAARTLVVSDENVAPLYLQRLLASLPQPPTGTLILPAGEVHKTLETCARVFDKLASMGAGRDACIIALGGGVIGDIAGFAAACWMRGIAVVQMPTTLLAMVDASVGGKTGVNLASGKNLVGAFHQPRAVVADIDTLATLPEREYRAGLAEVVKYGAIGDATFFAWLEENADALIAHEAETLIEAIERSCAHKAAVVARDETEAGERALLNFGHSFGHALETATGYASLLHGEAVATGMIMAARLSSHLQMAPETDARRLATLLERLGVPGSVPTGTDPRSLLTHMRLDKKNRDGHLHLVLWRGVGRAEVVAEIDENDVLAILRESGSVASAQHL